MGQERIIHAALLGAGTVGSGVYKLVKDLEEKRGKAFRLSF